jgi:hypothetical protein
MKTYKERYEEACQRIFEMCDEYAAVQCDLAISEGQVAQLQRITMRQLEEIERYQHDAAAKGVLYPQARDRA